MEVAHEPNHRLVKARIPVLLRHYGRIHSIALWAFDRIRDSCVRIAESTAHPQGEGLETPNHEPTFPEMPADVDKVDDAPTAPHEDEKTGSVGQETPNHEPTFAEILASVDRVNDAPTAPLEEEETGLVGQETPSHEPAFGEMPANVDKVDDTPTAPQEEEKTGSVGQETSNHEQTFGEPPANVDKVDDTPTAPQEEEKTGSVGQEIPNHESTFAEIPASVDGVVPLGPPTGIQIGSNLPTCGNCNGRLSFPCWYCIFCMDDLFICAACDTAGVPKLMRISGEHTEGHHLIRCQDPQMSGDTEREMSMEGRLNGMQTQLDDLTRRMGDHNDHMGDLNNRVGDLTTHTSGMANLIGELTGSITSLTSRIADIELILNRLAGAGAANGSV